MRVPKRLRDVALNREVLIVFAIVLLAFTVRTIFALPPAVENGFAPSGGSDSFYHLRIIEYVLDNGKQLLRDPALNYPFGAGNPRPPFFQWSIAVTAKMLEPFMDEEAAVGYPFLLNTAFFGALTVIPVYLLARAYAGRRAGYLAAFFLAFLPGHMSRSVATDADHDAMALFFIVWAIYFAYKALEEAYGSEGVRTVRGALGALRLPGKPEVYAALSAISMASAANVWTGYFYAFHIITIALIAYIIYSVVVRRHVGDVNLFASVYAVYFTVFSIPWYAVTGRVMQVWFFPQVLAIFGVLAFGLLMEYLWEKPWIVTIPATVGGAAAVVALIPQLRRYLHAVLRVYGKSKLYTTIAEAQPAPLATILLYFGAGVLILALAGFVYVYLKTKKENSPKQFLILSFTTISIWMTFSQARFVFTASLAIAFLGGVFGDRLIYYFRAIEEEIRKARKGRWRLKEYSTKALAVFVVGVLVFYPVMWFSVDAGIPYNNKSHYDRVVYGSLPSFLKPNQTSYNNTVRFGGGWYFGALGFRIPQKDDYWPRAWRWLAQQDRGLPIEDKPAFLSWWDYGFECIQEGRHPTVADNFQNSYQFAGQVLMAQNESEVLALFIARQLEAIYFENGHSIPMEVNSILISHLGVETAGKVYEALSNPRAFKQDVLNHPEKYGGNYSEDISDVNLRYVAIKGTLSPYGVDALSSLLDDLESYTGWKIRYIAVDSRMFPFSGRNPGIFYAPAKLSDHKVIEARGITVPVDFYDMQFVTENGVTYSIRDLPPNARVREQKIVYKPAFYRSMLYRVFIGYAGQWAGLDEGVPGLSENLYTTPPAQAWNLTHFKLVYRSVHDRENDTYIPIDQALKVRERNESAITFLSPFNLPGITPLFSDTVIVRYYPGATVHGRVTMPDGTPVEGVMVTIYDEYNIPHGFSITDRNGYYSLTAVAGHLKLVFSAHKGFNGQLQRRPYILGEVSLNVSEAQAERVNQDLDGNGVPDYIIEKDFVVKPSTISGIVFLDENGNGRYDSGEELLEGAQLIFRSEESGAEVKVTSGPLGTFTLYDAPPYSYNVTVIYKGNRYEGVRTFELDQGAEVVQDLPIRAMTVSGTVRLSMSQMGIRVEKVVLDGPERYEVDVQQNGNYTANVLPGTYRIYVDDPEWKSLTYIRGRVGETLVNQSLEVRQKVVLHVDIYGPGGERPSGIIVATNLADGRFSNTSAVSAGSVDMELWEGVYSLYFSGSGLSAIKLVTLRSSGSVTLFASPSIRVRIYTELSGSPVGSDVYIGNEEALFLVRTGNDGTTYVDIPKGDYSFAAFLVKENNSYFARVERHVAYGETVYLQLQMTQEAEVTAMSEGKPVNYVSLLVRDYYYILFSYMPSGRGTIPLELANYTKVALSSHFLPREFKGMDVDMGPRVVEVTVVYNSNRPIRLLFNGTGGNFTLELPKHDRIVLPVGEYNVTAESEGTGVEVDVGKGLLKIESNTVRTTFDPQISIKYRLILDLPAKRSSLNIYSNGSLYKSVQYVTGSEIYLPSGKYTILGSLPGGRGFITVVELNGPRRMRPQVGPMDEVKLTVDNPRPIMGTVFTFTSGEARFSRAFYSDVLYLKLPRGRYGVYAERYDSDTGYQYWVKGYFETTQGSVVLNLNSKYVGRGIGGTIELGGQPVRANLILYNEKGSQFRADVSQDGSYEITVQRGVYYVYAWYSGPNPGAYLGRIRYEGGKMWLNISLEKAYPLHVSLIANGTLAHGRLVVEGGGGRVILDVEGIATIYLPPGSYTLTAEAQRVEYGMLVNYTARQEIMLSGERTLGLNMDRKNVYGIEVRSPSGKIRMKPGEAVTVPIEIENTGNLVERVVLGYYGGPVSATPSVPVVEIPPSGQGKIVMVEYTIWANASAAGTYSVSPRISVEGSVERKSVNLNVEVLGRPSYTIRLDNESVRIRNGTVTFSISISTQANFTFIGNLSVYNLDQVRSRGWELTWLNVSAPGQISYEILGNMVTTTVKGNFSAIFQMKPIVPNPTTNVTIVLGLADRSYGLVGMGNITIDLRPINLEFEAEGGNVTMEVPPLNVIPMFIVFIAGMAFLTVLLPRRRRR